MEGFDSGRLLIALDLPKCLESAFDRYLCCLSFFPLCLFNLLIDTICICSASQLIQYLQSLSKYEPRWRRDSVVNL